jgi:chromosome segregation ATPase
VKIAEYETEGLLGPKQVETMQEVETLKSKIHNLEYRFNTTLIKTGNVRDVITLMKDNKVSMDRTYDELRKEISQLRSQLGTVTDLPLKVKKLESDISHMTTDISLLKRAVKRQPTDQTHTLTYKDGSDHTFRVYKSPAGLVNPHVAVNDLILGKKYVDLNEPLD